MSETTAKFRVVFDPERYSQRVLALILDKAEAWKCSPLEAEARLLDQLAEETLKKDGEAA
jgi:hypothetical protein